MTDSVDEFLDDMTCPRCGELEELPNGIRQSAFFEGRNCQGCEMFELQRHLDEGCTKRDCACQPYQRPPEAYKYMAKPTDIEDL